MSLCSRHMRAWVEVVQKTQFMCAVFLRLAAHFAAPSISLRYPTPTVPLQVVAIIATYNEERFIGGCLEHLFANGVEAYLCDNESTDRTVEIAKSYLGRGLVGIETIPRDGTYRWKQILARKQQLAAELAADWFLHLDADEVPQSSRPGQTLAEALADADAAGYNAVDFHELTFVATRESPDHDHPDFRRTMRWYYPFAPGPLHLVRAWKRQPKVDLVRTGGHQASFRGRRISPQPLFLRHYLILSHEHMLRKYVRRSYDAGEVRKGWHGWRAKLTETDLRLPSQARLRFTAGDADLDASSPRRQHFIEWPVIKRETTPGVADARPLVLCIVDRPGWAHERKTRGLAAALAGEYRLMMRYQSEVSEADILAADLVLVYYWLQIDRLSHLTRVLERVRDRLMLGACSEYELQGAWRGPGLATLSTLPRAVFANNLRLAKQLEATLGREVFYTPNGVDTSFFQPAAAPLPPLPLRAGWAGSLQNQSSAHRGVHEFIVPAVAAVEGAELCLAAREHRWRDLEAMREFYQSLHVYVCASRSEGTPNPCLEAAACGLPVVSTPVGNMPEFIRDGDNGLFVTRDVDEIAARLRLLRDDPELRERMGRAARATAEAWDWRHQAPRYAEMFEAVLDGRLPLRQTRTDRAVRQVRRVGARVAALWRRST
jgi:glycosyltransferase involved in cell wall biosynthesis